MSFNSDTKIRKRKAFVIIILVHTHSFILCILAEVARTGEIRSEFEILVWKPDGKRTLGRPRIIILELILRK